MVLRLWFMLLSLSVVVGCGTPAARSGDPGSGAGPRRAGDDAALAWTLPSGQDARLARMLGADGDLPDGCRVIEVSTTPSFARARYRCESMPAPFEVQLRHVSSTHNNVVRTARFAITRVDPAGGPDVLVAELARRVRRDEAAVQWRPPSAAPRPPSTTVPAPDASAAPGPATAPSPAAPPPPDPPLPSPPPAQISVMERRGASQGPGVDGWWYQPAPFAQPGGYGVLQGRDPLSIALAWLTDGVLFLLLVTWGLTAVLRRQLEGSAARIPALLAGITVLGAVLRLAIARDAPMNAFAFQRVLPLAAQIIHGPTLSLLSAGTGEVFYLTGVISWTNFALACLTPPALFAHARYLLRDERAALAAAAFIALLPMHIRFSRSDVQFIASLLSSSLTFVALYGSLTEREPGRARAFLVLLPILSLATYLSRPENIIFAVLDGGAILLYADREVPRRRRALVIALVLAAAAWSMRINLLAHFSANVRDGLSPRTLLNALRVLVDPARNTLLNPRVTPTGLGLLAALGFARLWRTGERRRALFLAAWLGAFFVVHSYVFAQPMMMARYHLHLVTPVILLAAAGVPWLLDRAPRAALALGVYACAWPLLHLPFERDVRFSEMHELAFLKSLRGRVPEGCAVLEFTPATSPMMPEQPEASRVGRASSALIEGRLAPAIRFVSLASFAPGRRYTARDAETLTDEARALLASPPRCLMLYQGLTCRTHVPTGMTLAPACAEALARVRVEAVSAVSFAARRYDDPNVGRLVDDGRGGTRSVVAVPDGERVTLTLWRVLGPR